MSETDQYDVARKLTAHFTLGELIRSDLAKDLRDPNLPSATELDRLEQIVAPGLERARSILKDHPIHVTSGFRNERVNRAAGGVPTSAHRLGYAVDFHAPGLATRTVATMLAHSDLMFDQLIWEVSRGVVHLSFDPRARREVLTQRAGAGSPFLKGLVG